MGAPLGPWGMAGGAVIGGLYSAFSGDGDNAAQQAPPAQFAAGNGSDLTNQLAALQYSEGLSQQQAQNAREAAFYNQANGNFDIANAAQLRGGPVVQGSATDQQRQLAALGQTNAQGQNMANTGNLLTSMGTAPMGDSYAAAQLRQGQDTAMAQQLSMARSGRSLGSGQAAMNQAAFNNSAINQQTNQGAAAARLQEQQNYNQFQLGALQGAGNAYGGAGALAGQAGNQATTVRAGNEGLQAQNAALGQQQQQINNQTTGMYNQLGAQQQASGLQANAQGQNAYQFGQQQGQNMQTAQLNANLGQASSQTATNIANQNNANAHQAANMNMLAGAAGQAANVLGDGNSAPVNANNPSGSTSPYKGITDSSHATDLGESSDERAKTNIRELGSGQGTMPSSAASPYPMNTGKYASFNPADAAYYRAADGAARTGADTFTANGKTLQLHPMGDAPMDSDTNKVAVTGEDPGPSNVASYAETIAALNGAYRPSQNAPTDVLNHVAGAGAGPSASQAAVIAALSGKHSPIAPPVRDIIAAGGDPARMQTPGPKIDPATHAMLSSRLSSVPGQPLTSYASSQPPPPAPAFRPAAPNAAWGDVFNQPELDPRVQAYLSGQRAPAPVAPPPSIFGGKGWAEDTASTNYSGGEAPPDYANEQSQVDRLFGGNWNSSDIGGKKDITVMSDQHSKTRIRELETQLAALSAPEPGRDGETTRLSAPQESGFQQWLKQNNVRDLDNPDAHYDYRGAYLGGVGRGSSTGHFPDTYKQHGHPSFSIESQYSRNANDGGTWEGERFSPPVSPQAPDTSALDASEYGQQVRPGVDFRNAHGYSYEYKDPNAPGAAPGQQVGTMAQELERTSAAPYVHDTPSGKQVDTRRLPLALAPAIGETQRRVDDLEAQLNALQGSGLPAYGKPSSAWFTPGAAR